MNLSVEMRQAAEAFASTAASELTKMLTAQLSDGIERSVWVVWRVKSDESIVAKAGRRSRDLAPGDLVAINDLIGVRAVVLHVGLIKSAVDLIRGWSSSSVLRLRREQDYFADPASGKYRGVHLDFEFLHSEANGLDERCGVEIQVTTYLQQLQGFLSHKFVYKKDTADNRLGTIEKIADQLSNIDLQVAELFRTL